MPVVLIARKSARAIVDLPYHRIGYEVRGFGKKIIPAPVRPTKQRVSSPISPLGKKKLTDADLLSGLDLKGQVMKDQRTI